MVFKRKYILTAEREKLYFEDHESVTSDFVDGVDEAVAYGEAFCPTGYNIEEVFD